MVEKSEEIKPDSRASRKMPVSDQADPAGLAMPTKHNKFRLKSRTGMILIGVIGGLVLAAAAFAWYASRYESTDDAQIAGHIDPMSARIAGQIKSVYVENGQLVNAGTLLVQIDASDYQKALDEAKAAYDQAVAKARADQLNVQVVSVKSAGGIDEARAGLEVARSRILTSRQAHLQAEAEAKSAQAQDTLAQLNLKRAEGLVAQKVISQQSFDQYEAAARSAAAALAASRDQVTAASKGVAQAQAQMRQAQAALKTAESGPDQIQMIQAQAQSTAAAVQKARAAMEQAQLNLEYTRIAAPVAGVIGNKTAEIGQNVSSGQVLMDLVQINDVWVSANFKETQLQHMRPGQRVTIHVDAFDRDYKGRVSSIGAATGAQFSLFPPENATGNYVKVVQRIPVKIVFDEEENRDHLLRPGMSVEPKVWIK